MAGGKTNYELGVVNSTALAVPGDIGLGVSSGNCTTIAINAPIADGSTPAASPAIQCTISSPGRIGAGATIQLVRTATGLYNCTTTGFGAAAYKPTGCS
ncbi:hypothetical protein [Cupriavidus necator]|uniref:hypothetical protein n=1 Tax=Cupriavidus necator TaxID=106590 RepID=UPI003F73560B